MLGGETLRAALADYGTAYQEWQLARRRVAELTELTRTRTADLHALRSGVARIEALDPQPDEDVHLKAEDERLGHAEGLRVAALEASTLLLGDDVGSEVVGAISLLGRARAALGAQSEHDPQLAELATRAADVAALLSDLGAELSSYADRIDLDGERLAAVQLRRSALREVTRDFGGDVATTLAWLGEASERLLAVDTAADDLAQARREEEGVAGAQANSPESSAPPEQRRRPSWATGSSANWPIWRWARPRWQSTCRVEQIPTAS